RYVQVTGDRSLLLDGGAELLFETARLWVGLGAYIPAQGGAFCLNEVTGPDEYTALVNNNLYTNLMAREHLRQAIRVADELARDEPEAWARLAGRIGLSLTEVDGWRQAADRMRVPRDEALGIHLQDDAFLDREPWDFAATPADHYPLLLHYHPLVIYRHQVLKQPDVVLAQVLLSHSFTTAEKRRNFAFYDPLTTGDSSLAPCIQSVAAAELGQAEAARRYFASTARMDLDDVNGNTRDGVHIAAMAGTWVSVVNGFAGLRDDDGRLSFAPRLPDAWHRLAFRLRVGTSRLRIAITPVEATYAVESGPPVELRHFGEAVTVLPGQPAVFDLRPRLRAVVFDLDGVLTDSAELHYQAWARMAAEEGLPFSRELNEQLKGIGRLESLEIILAAAGRTSLDAAEKTVLTERKNAYFGELIARITPADLLPGIAELLADLRAVGIRIAIASASHNATELVRRLGIESLVDAKVDPSTIVKGKPDPEIFLAAAELLGVRPEDCVGVEDARAGIEAINAAGMVSVGVGPSLTEASWAVDDTRQITREALAALFHARG
ncbi:MAG TPA: beta-phosphoglucomutase, partial [Candidatus Limnocylindrales bacterium]